LEQFVINAQPDVDKILSDLNQTIKDFESLVSYFGEDLKDNDPEGFFGKWKVFLNNVFEGREKISLFREKEEKQRRRDEAKLRSGNKGVPKGGENTEGGEGGGENTEGGEGGERGRGRGRPRGGPRGGPRGRGRGGQQHVVDELFSKLKDGGILSKNKN